MIIDYQVVVNLFCCIIAVCVPLGITMLLCEKVIDIFISSVIGKNVRV